VLNIDESTLDKDGVHIGSIYQQELSTAPHAFV